MMVRWRVVTALVAVVAVSSVEVFAQGIAARVDAAPDGAVLVSFAARAGVCGNGRDINMRERHDAYWENDCDAGPVRVVLTRGSGSIVDIDTYVGGRWRQGGPKATDLGTVSARAAVDYLMLLAVTLPANVGERAIFPIVLADSVEVWPDLLRLAKDASRPSAVRKTAVFWVGQAATERAVQGLTELIDDQDADRDVRERAVFALSQLPDDQGVPKLIELARTHQDPAVRKRALFWLGQSGDARALALFEELLLKPDSD